MTGIVHSYPKARWVIIYRGAEKEISRGGMECQIGGSGGMAPQKFFSNMAPNKSISDFGGAPGLPGGGAPDHFGMPGGYAPLFCAFVY